MAGQYLYVTKGYNNGWSANSSDLRRSAGGGSWLSVADGNKSSFYRTSGGTWRRWFSGINSDGTISGFSSSDYSYLGNPYSLPINGVAEVTFLTNGNISTGGSWDPAGHPDNGDIEIRATLTSGSSTFLTGPGGGNGLNTFYSLSSARTWTIQCLGGDESSCILDVQFRHIPTSITLANIPVTLEVIYVP